jgi:putative membrane protein
MRGQTHPAMLFAATAALGALVACDQNQNRSNELRMDSAAGTVVDEEAWIRDSMRTDATIMGVLHEANKAEIDASQLAKSRASDTEVKTFASQMIDDHKRLDERADSLLDALDINRANLPDAIEDAHERDLDSLKKVDNDTSTMASSFDRAFIGQQVRAHRHVLELVDMAIQRAERAEVKNALQNEVRPSVASHLQRAEAIQKRIAG